MGLPTNSTDCGCTAVRLWRSSREGGSERTDREVKGEETGCEVVGAGDEEE